MPKFFIKTYGCQMNERDSEQVAHSLVARGYERVGHESEADVVLLSNILHDWDVAACRALVKRCAESLRPGGQIVIHDVLLNDELDGPLPIALYSAALFSLTEGRAYSAAEYRQWLTDAGLQPSPPVPTLVHCHAIVGK